MEYNCGCGNSHKLNDSYHIASASPKKFILMCNKSICTFVDIQKKGDSELAVPKWFVSAKTLRKMVVLKLDI